jgi:hypothetical protein
VRQASPLATRAADDALGKKMMEVCSFCMLDGCLTKEVSRKRRARGARGQTRRNKERDPDPSYHTAATPAHTHGLTRKRGLEAFALFAETDDVNTRRKWPA